MPRAYLIGGAPRVGKSTLAGQFLAARPMTHAYTDDLRAAVRAATTPAATPDLFYLDSLNADEANMARLMREQTSEIIAAADRESAYVWPAALELIHRELAAGHDVLIEGVAVLPQFLAKADFPYTALFLGNQSPAHSAIIHQYAADHPDSWLGSLQPETIDAFAHFTQTTSRHVELEASKYQLPYLEMSSGPFANTLGTALEMLQKQ